MDITKEEVEDCMRDHNWTFDLSAGEAPPFGPFAVAGGGHVYAGVTKAMDEHPYLRKDVNLSYANAQVRREKDRELYGFICVLCVTFHFALSMSLHFPPFALTSSPCPTFAALFHLRHT